MKIGIDASRANRELKTGTEWYSYRLIEELKKIIPEVDRPILYSGRKLQGALGKLPGHWREKRLGWPPKYLWTQLRLWFELIVSPPDVLLVPAHTIPFLPFPRKVKIIVAVHDVGWRRFPELYRPITRWYHDLTLKRIKCRADIVLTISEFSRREIIDLAGVPEEKIKVVFPGYDRRKFQPAAGRDRPDILKRLRVRQPFLFYLGRLEKKKNILNLIRTFSLLAGDFSELQLVLAGGSGNVAAEAKRLAGGLGPVGKRIIFPGYLNQAVVPVFFSQAEIFLFLTRYEGFGLPIIQAFGSGTPVVASQRPVHQEVAGAAAVFADPENPREISEAVRKLLVDQRFYQEKVSQGLVRAEKFSWRKTAEGVWRLAAGLVD